MEKWIEIGKNVSSSSEVYMLHAADCHSPKTRLKVTYDKIIGENYDWYDQTLGYFYSFISDRIILYDYVGLTNLNMSLKTDFIKSLPYSDLKRGIDGYIHNHCDSVCKKQNRKLNHYYDKTLYKDSVDTHGFNNISVDREKFFESKPHIFKIQQTQLEDLPLNMTTLEKIRYLGGTQPQKQNKNYDLSIIISTYKGVKYLGECFDSIINSIGTQKVEVLIGIDGCQESKDFVLTNSFPEHFKFYFFDKNVGPYIVFNTLSNLSDSDKIMFFGSDDIMSPNMVNNMINGLTNSDFFRSSYVNFKNGENFNSNSSRTFEGGVFSIKKEVFEYMNGFEPWKCEADSEFALRMSKSKYKTKLSNNLDFFRRIHNEGLTSRTDTGYRSKLRAEYRKLYHNKKTFGPLPKKVTEPFTEITVTRSSVTPQPQEPVKEKNHTLLSKLMNVMKIDPQPVQEQKTIDYDNVNETLRKREIQKQEPKPINKNSNKGMAQNIKVSKNMNRPILLPKKPGGGSYRA